MPRASKGSRSTEASTVSTQVRRRQRAIAEREAARLARPEPRRPLAHADRKKSAVVSTPFGHIPKRPSEEPDGWCGPFHSVFGSHRVNLCIGVGSNNNNRSLEELPLIRNSRFGIGTKRTLQQVQQFTGINLREERMEVNKCGNLNWVPYQESIDCGVPGLLQRDKIGHAATSPLHKT